MPLQLFTHNVNGFDIKSKFISDLCSALPMCVYGLQEHWLTPPYKKFPGVNKLKSVHANLDGWGTSAMKEKMCSEVRTGRPFGGTGFIWSKSLSESIKPRPEYCHDRVTVVEITANVGSILIINVYMPYYNVNDIVNQTSLYQDTLAFIEMVINDNSNSKIILMGDMNCDIFARNSNSFSLSLNDFIKERNLHCCYDLMQSFNHDKDFTRCNLKQKSFSLLDYIFVSKDLIPFIENTRIVNHALNTSDHLPVELSLSIDIVTTRTTPHFIEKRIPAVVNWRKINDEIRNNYENVMSDSLDSLSIPSILHGEHLCNDTDHIFLIEKYYNDILRCIHEADLVLPRCVPTQEKEYWNDHLNVLKNDSIVAHDFWKMNNCPRSGPIFEAKKDAHYKYKLYLRKCQNERNQQRADDINNDLLNGDSNKCWKSHKHFNHVNSKSTCNIDGLVDDADIADRFASNFKNVYDSRNVTQSEKLLSEFNTLYNSYSQLHFNDSIRPYFFSWSDMLNIVSKLKTGKATASFVKPEHILYGSPKLIVHLHLLFNAMLQHSYVPNEFLNGLITPLIKDSEGDHSSVDNYRGLTLGVVFSFLFEHGLLLKIGHLLETDSLQCGYKKRHSTSHAIYTLRSCIDYFTSRGSNVFAAFLDCSKGFDKVEHSGIYLKLIRRGVPICVIRILIYWYSNLSSVVKWNNALSSSFSVRSGVRQGGVLSPHLFSIYVDDLIVSLKNLRIGCHIGDLFIASIVYADDICLLAPCRSVLQSLLNECEKYGIQWCLTYNPTKSKVMLFGKPCSFTALKMYEKDLETVEKCKYLGITVVAGKSFSVSETKFLRNFRCSVNTVLSVRQRSSEQVLMKLLYAICVPTLTYACDAFSYSNKQLNSMNIALNDSIRRVFTYNRWESVTYLRLVFGFPSLVEIFHQRTQRFLKLIPRTRNPTLVAIKALDDT